MDRKFVLGVLALVGAVVAAGPVLAQAYPARSVTIVAPYPPGGGVDVAGRLLAPKLSEHFKQSFVIDNRAGASGIVGTQYVMAAKPDGYTLLLAASIQVLAQFLMPVNYNMARDFTAITQVSEGPLVLTLARGIPAKDIASLLDYLKSRNLELRWGVSGFGGADHLAAELFNGHAGIKGLMVPYKGGGAALSALLTGEIDAVMLPPSVVRGHHTSGTLTAVGITSTEESQAMPGIKAIGKSGLTGYEFLTWFGIWGPKDLPPQITRQLNSALVTILKDAQFSAKLIEMGSTPVGSTPEAFASFVNNEIRKSETLIREKGIKAQ